MDETALISLGYIQEKRKIIQSQIDGLNGALEMLQVIQDELFTPEVMSMDDLKKRVGAETIEEPREV